MSAERRVGKQRDLAELPAAALAVIEAAPDAMVISDRLGRIVVANSQAARLFGYELEELRGHPIEVLIPERFRAHHPGHRNRYFLDPRTRPMGAGGIELWGLKKDGSEFPAEISLSPLESDDGMLSITAIRDVTLRRRLESKFKNLLEAAPDAVVIVDQSGRIVLVNAQAERLFGYRREELLGELVEALIPKRFRGHHSTHRKSYSNEPKVRSMGQGGLQLFGLRKDGREFPAEISLSPLETEDGLWTMTAIRDASDRMKAEEERIRLAQAQEAVRVRDEFLSIASHELRTPLTALQLQLEGLDRALASEEPATRERAVGRVHKAVRHTGRLAELIDTLLDVSRIVSGRIALKREPLDAVALVREVVDEFQEQAARAGCGLELTTIESAAADWDRFRVEQVLVNLITNALKYGAGKPVSIDVAASADAVVITISDRGIGIEPGDSERIFGRFERGVSMQHYGGLGLGLYIARYLVELHGGSIGASGAPGSGASFRVELPTRAPD